jgi:hypothetical protein
MGILAALGYSGYSRITFPFLEKNERLLVGALLLALGVFAYFFR